MLKLKVHPTFWILAFILVLQNKFLYLIASLAAVFIHEWAHAKVAYNNGYYLDTLTLMPYGAMLKGEDNFRENEGLKIAFAGPLSNLVICTALLAIWWILPVSYNYTKVFFDASLTIGFFNLLPIFPLDGARIILAISKNKIKTLKIMKGFGIVISGLLGIAFLLTYFVTPNYSLGIMSAILYVSSVGCSDKEAYKIIGDNCPYVKKLDVPIKKCTVLVHYNLKLIRVLKHIKADTETSFEIVNDKLETLKILTEGEVRALALKENLHKPLKELLRP